MNYILYTLLLDASQQANSTNYEQLAKNYRIVSIIMFALAIVCLAVAIISFIVFKVPKIIGDLSGRTAKKSIDKMRKENENVGKKQFKPNYSKQAAKSVENKGNTQSKSSSTNKAKPKAAASQMKQQKAPAKPVSNVKDNANSTINLGYDAQATDVLNNNSSMPSGCATTKLDYDEQGTEILSYDSNGTEVLTPNMPNGGTAKADNSAATMKIIQDIVYIHTKEII